MSRGPGKSTEKGVNLVGDVLRAWRESQVPSLGPNEVAELMGVGIGHYRLHESVQPRRFLVASEKFLRSWLKLMKNREDCEFWRVKVFSARIQQITDPAVLQEAAQGKSLGLDDYSVVSGLREDFRVELGRQMKTWRPGLFRQIEKTLRLSKSVLEEVVNNRVILSHVQIVALAKLVDCSPHQWLMMAGYLPLSLKSYFERNPLLLDLLADMEPELVGECLDGILKVIQVSRSSKKKSG